MVDGVADLRGRGRGEHQLAYEDARELRRGRVEGEERGEHVDGLVDHRACVGQRAEGLVDGRPETMLEHERDEILLGPRIEEERPLRDPGALGDRRRRGRREPSLDEERLRRLADARELLVLVGLPPHEK